LLTKLKGLPATLRLVDELKKQAHPVDEQALNQLGYRLLYGGMEQEGVSVFQKNVQEHPQSSNVYDSLGEAYAKVGQKDLAIQNYEKSLQLNPNNNNAVERLKKLKGEAANPRVLEQDGFTVVGIAARTSNAKETTPDGIIGKQWARIFQEGVIEKIPNKTDHNIVAVYTDYAGDSKGEYTYLLGARVNSDANVPAGMIARKIPGGKFAVFTSEKGPAPKVVPATWMKIDSLPNTVVGGDRVYRADFEIYDERASDPENLQVDVYVGIK